MAFRQASSAGTILFVLACAACANDPKEPKKPEQTELAAVKSSPAAEAPGPDARTAPTPPAVVHLQDQVMGTVVNITVWTADEAKARAAGSAVFAEFKRVDALMSSWLSDSAVAQINDGAGSSAVVVNEELFALIGRALDAGKKSSGAFDITVGAFRGLWKFDQDIDGSIPSKGDVAARTKLVNYRQVEVDEERRSVKLARQGMRLTLGGIAKGHALDRGVAILREQGVENFILQAGGDLFASGSKSGRKWRVGIRDPRGARESSFAVAEIEDRTFSTSGDYERFVVKDGVRYHHLLDPKTGRPATKSRSVTVLAPDALTADIWSTALFIMGHKAGLPLVEARSDLDAVFVDKDNLVHISSGLKGSLRLLNPPTPGL